MSVQETPERGMIERGLIAACKVTAVGAFTLAATAIAIEIIDPTETTLNYKGESHLVHIGDQVSVPIVRDVTVYAGGDAKHDVNLMPDSAAHNRGLFLQNIEYIPGGMLELQAFEDDKIGFYILMSEYDGQTSKEFDYGNIMLTTKQPFSCGFGLDVANEDDNYIEPDQACLEFMGSDPDGWHGIEHSSFSKGGVFGTNLGNTPPTKARIMTDTHLENNWCQYGLRFGLDEELVFWNNEQEGYMINGTVNISENDVYEGVRDRIIAVYRKIASDSTGLPLTKNNGMPIFLTHSQRDYLVEIANEYGPLKDLSPEEYRRVMQLEFATRGNQNHEPLKIEIDRPVAYELKELKKKYPDIVINEITESGDWVEDGNETDYVLNYNCLPLVEEKLADYSEESVMTNSIASYTGIVPGAILVDDPSMAAEDTLRTIYINNGARNLFADKIQQVLPSDEVTNRIILYKQRHGLDLTQAEEQYLQSRQQGALEGGNG